jgi:hypothetical protein
VHPHEMASRKYKGEGEEEQQFFHERVSDSGKRKIG